MKAETIEKILNFLEDKEGMEIPQNLFNSIKKLKLIEKLENHPDGTQYRYNEDLMLNYSKIKKLPNDLYVEGSLGLQDCRQLTKLPDKLYVGGDLFLTHSNITKLPDDLYVGGVLDIRDTPLANKYTDKQIYRLVASTGGEITGKILR
jgi:hypothetical protein